MTFTLPDLPYSHDALEPTIDAETMRIHHGKHHAGYVEKLNNALDGTQWLDTPLEQLLRDLGDLPKEVMTPVRNNGGGHFNHSMFWTCLAPPGKGGGGRPEGVLGDTIDEQFGSFDAFKESFAITAATRFGSGWAWLCMRPDDSLRIVSTANQDTCFMPEDLGGFGPDHLPLLGLDVWEHAYYLKHRNDRSAYIKGWWDVVNWTQVARHVERVRESAAILQEA